MSRGISLFAIGIPEAASLFHSFVPFRLAVWRTILRINNFSGSCIRISVNFLSVGVCCIPHHPLWDTDHDLTLKILRKGFRRTRASLLFYGL